jgi:hypothetical protein
MWTFSIFSAAFSVTFYITTWYFTKKHDWQSLYKANHLFKVFLGASMLLVSIIFSCSLCYLHASLTQASFSGQMNRRAISLNAFCYFCLFITIYAQITIDESYNWFFTVIVLVQYLLFAIIEVATFWIVIHFEPNFELKTVILANGLVEIVGVNKKGTEVFKFMIGQENEASAMARTLNAVGITESTVKVNFEKSYRIVRQSFAHDGIEEVNDADSVDLVSADGSSDNDFDDSDNDAGDNEEHFVDGFRGSTMADIPSFGKGQRVLMNVDDNHFSLDKDKESSAIKSIRSPI